MLNEEVVVLDFETTGLYPESGDRITEVAAIRIRNGQIADRFESMVNCGLRLDPFIVQFTGISQKMVDGAPSPKSVMRELSRFVGSHSVFAHNASFDQRFYGSECRHVGLGEPDTKFICTMRLARRVYPGLGSYKLGEVAQSVGLKYSGRAHRAAADAGVAADLTLSIAAAIRSRFKQLEINASLLRRIMVMPIASAMTRLAQLR